MQRPLAVGEREDAVVTDVRLACQGADGSRKLVEMALHAELADERLHVLAGTWAGGALVVAQRGDPSLRQRLRDQTGAAIGSRQEGRIPIAVGRAAARHHHHGGKRPGTRRPDQRAINGRRVQLPGDVRTLARRIVRRIVIGHDAHPVSVLRKVLRAVAQVIDVGGNRSAPGS